MSRPLKQAQPHTEKEVEHDFLYTTVDSSNFELQSKMKVHNDNHFPNTPAFNRFINHGQLVIIS